MTMRVWALLLTLVAATAAGAEAEQAKKPAEPFYRKYLVPGNRLDDRILEQERRVNAAPDDANLRNDFGNLLAARRFHHQAAEQYEVAAKLDKTNFVSLYNLGLLRETEGKVGQAIRAYQKSIDRKHGFPPAHFRLGRLYEHSGKSSEAVSEYSAALQIDPAMRDPRRNPLVVDSELMYQASLANYSRDVASASMARESVYVEEGRFRAVPIDRPVSAQEAAGQDELEPSPEPRQIGASDAAGAAGGVETVPGSGGGRRTGSRPTSQEPSGTPMRPRPGQNPPRRNTRPGIPPSPPGSTAPAPAPPVEVAPPPPEPEAPPETMPEPAPSTEEEPS